MTLYYTIKNNNIGFFKYIIRKVFIIFQIVKVLKLKYIKAIFKQIYIFNIKTVDLIF